MIIIANNSEKNVITNATALKFVLDNYTLPEDVEAKISKLYEQTTRKSVSKADKEKEALNEELASVVLDSMVAGQPMTATAVANLDSRTPSTSKATNILKRPVAAGAVENTKEKGKSFYTKVG